MSDPEPIKSIGDFLKPNQRKTPQDILLALVDGTKDIDLKTEINDPWGLTLLTLCETYLMDLNLPKSAKVLKDGLKIFLRYQFSKDRESRREIVRALEAMFSERREIVKSTDNSLASKLLRARK